jgi:hypothetical protein
LIVIDDCSGPFTPIFSELYVAAESFRQVIFCCQVIS